MGLDDKRKAAVVNNGRINEDDLLNEGLERIQASGRHHRAAYWVSTFSDYIKKLEKRLANRLVEQGVLRKEEKRFLGVVLGGEAPDAHTAAVFSLVRACDLLGRVFTHDELKTARRQIEALRRGEAISEAEQQAIETIAAATSAAIAAAMS